MTFRAKGHTETFTTAQECAAFALGTANIIYIALDMFMSMDGRTCTVERI